MRTTLDIDDPIMEELKSLQKREKKSLGQLASSLLAEALKKRQSDCASAEPNFEWTSSPMVARVDIHDKEALYRILDQA